jgi:hypothetical protein
VPAPDNTLWVECPHNLFVTSVRAGDFTPLVPVWTLGEEMFNHLFVPFVK